MGTLSAESPAGPGLRDQMVSVIEARALMTVTGDDAADVIRAVRTVLVDLGEHDIVDVVAVAPYSTKTLVDALWTGLHQERWARPPHTEEALRHVDGVLARRTQPVLVLHHTHQWRTEALETVGGIWKTAGGAPRGVVIAALVVSSYGRAAAAGAKGVGIGLVVQRTRRRGGAPVPLPLAAAWCGVAAGVRALAWAGPSSPPCRPVRQITGQRAAGPICSRRR
ncbi:hypothetical protein ACWCXX_33490 [Streptomyces sp. NPDC001732]